MDNFFNFSQINNQQSYQHFIGNNEQYIDKGSNGEVYRALINETLAIAVKKIILSSHNYLEEIETLNKETNLLMILSHPNIVKVYFRFNYIDSSNKRIYVIGMEYQPMNLLSKLINKKLSEDEVSLLAKDLHSALAYLQRNKVSHRDIKPANILITKDGQYKICDFSEFKQQEPSLLTTRFTIQNTVCGTPLYLAPELQSHLMSNPAQ